LKHTLLTSIPTEKDWADTRRDEGLALDREYAEKIFGGLSREQAVQHFFATQSLERIEDLRWMPPVPFRFYLLACLDYVQSDRLRADPKQRLSRPDAASAFLRLIAGRLERWPEDVRPLLDEVLPVVDFIAAHQSNFDANEATYGSFPALAAKIHELAKRGSG
jgi:hypothetical protein